MVGEGYDDEAHVRRCFELARTAAQRGDDPFGSVLVADDEVVATASNRVHTDEDLRGHPELDLAFRAAREYDPESRRELVLYTSTEPCPMCAGGLAIAGLGRVVYSVSSEALRELTGGAPSVRAATILGDRTEVVGPVLPEAGLAVHEAFGW
ncbi:MAG: nucleoside deaminase [Halobacteriaceae archaeon]